MTSLDAAVRCAGGESLDAYLRNWVSDAKGRTKLAAAVAALAEAGVALSGIIAGGPLSGPMDAEIGEANADGDRQRKLDVIADQVVMDALRETSTAYYASEEEDAILTFDSGWRSGGGCRSARRLLEYRRQYVHRHDFFDLSRVARRRDGVLLPPGAEQFAAGYIVYGPQTALVLTLGEGVAHFVLDRRRRNSC